MITIHPDPSPQSSSFWADEGWLSFNMLQACIDIELVHPMIASDYGLTPIRPAVMAEGGYEGVEFGREITPLDVRRQAYWTYLAGGHHVYGHNDHYQTPDRWREWIDSRGSYHVGTFRSIVESLPRWWDVTPDQSIIQRGVGEGVSLCAAARDRFGDWALVYFSLGSSRRVTVRMDRIRTSDVVTATWIDPVSGGRTPIGSYAYEKPVEFETPRGWADALLLLSGPNPEVIHCQTTAQRPR